ncbi:hypothetical protein FWD07_01085 [Candidatus Saccharibacteria bacterium]|nr:hypothetical protein [Candidatus Saccharibacteria bacterium]
MKNHKVPAKKSQAPLFLIAALAAIIITLAFFTRYQHTDVERYLEFSRSNTLPSPHYSVSLRQSRISEESIEEILEILSEIPPEYFIEARTSVRVENDFRKSHYFDGQKPHDLDRFINTLSETPVGDLIWISLSVAHLP